MRRASDDIIERYLQELDEVLRDLPKARRREVVEEVASHIEDARAELASQGEAEMRNVLERLGTPEEIAAEARERFGVQQRDGSAREVAAILLLLFGGFVFVIGWFVGLVLLWASRVWTIPDKLIGTLIVPGGFALTLLVLSASLEAGGCTQRIDRDGKPIPGCVDSGGSSLLHDVLVWGGLTVLVLGPLFTSAYLARRMRRPRAATTG
jgi:hypothetical protein